MTGTWRENDEYMTCAWQETDKTLKIKILQNHTITWIQSVDAYDVYKTNVWRTHDDKQTTRNIKHQGVRPESVCGNVWRRGRHVVFVLWVVNFFLSFLRRTWLFLFWLSHCNASWDRRRHQTSSWKLLRTPTLSYKSYLLSRTMSNNHPDCPQRVWIHIRTCADLVYYVALVVGSVPIHPGSTKCQSFYGFWFFPFLVIRSWFCLLLHQRLNKIIVGIRLFLKFQRFFGIRLILHHYGWMKTRARACLRVLLTKMLAI